MRAMASAKSSSQKPSSLWSGLLPATSPECVRKIGRGGSRACERAGEVVVEEEAELLLEFQAREVFGIGASSF